MELKLYLAFQADDLPKPLPKRASLLQQVEYDGKLWLGTQLPDLCSQEDLDNARRYLRSLVQQLFPNEKELLFHVLSPI